MPLISASKLRNHFIGEPLVDWLDRYGKDQGYVQDSLRSNYLREAQLKLFTQAKGVEFEERLLPLIREFTPVTLIDRTGGREEARLQTLQAIRDRDPAIYQGLLLNEEQMLYGYPDFIILGSAIEAICPGTMGDLPLDTYYVLDIKFKGLGLNKNGDLAAKHKWEKTQLAIYELILAKILNRTPTRAFLMGRSLSGAKGKDLHCFSQLGWIKPPEQETKDQIKKALDWLDDLGANGHAWSPGDAQLPIAAPGQNDGDWHEVKRELYEAKHPIDPTEPLLIPERFLVNREEWIENRGIEFFVDYETASSLNDDFSLLPKMNGKPMIFMIGCGHMENGEFQFKVWTAESETRAEEERIIQAWLHHMAETQKRLAPTCEKPSIFHWTPHEVRSTPEAVDRPEMEAWKELPWYDLHFKLMKENSARVRGSSSLGLKTVAKTLYSEGKIQTVWGESPSPAAPPPCVRLGIAMQKQLLREFRCGRCWAEMNRSWIKSSPTT